MKQAIHPKWYPAARVTCACGNVFTVGATYPELSVEICSNCHPFYTGQMRFVDTQGRVEHFRAKQAGAKKKVVSKSDRRKAKKAARIEKELEKPETLEQLRSDKQKTK
ncbi:50S ribosomal protein L31 [Candidatus Woesebacteria bacterium GWB1_43_5]|uniref:Large ribosomal subunit protein bL31 n=1 Tax=Candidatus Woesebacteria bacterium GWB1_43_5 TaxID=1802474 RepID=A0A1F7WS93_9BACT|nr:MAG: 50S ribosomal protein L31 [Candidatus Woesebacteria bacterium GWB1_43_5]